jgi:ribosomal-protein-alanine N-acetyltransferase
LPDAPHLFRTDRFVASRIRADDLQDFQSFYADPAVMSTMSADGRVWPATESSDLFDRHLADWEEHGFGTWVFRDPENGAFVARAGLCSLDIGSGPVVELFYGVASGLWGRGVATEIAREVIRIAFRDLRAEFLVGFTLPTNLASRRVLEKCSFYRDGEIEHAGLRLLLFRLEGDSRLDAGTEAPTGAQLPSLNLERLEAVAIERALERTEWHQGRASQLLGVPDRTLHRKIKGLGLRRPD